MPYQRVNTLQRYIINMVTFATDSGPGMVPLGAVRSVGVPGRVSGISDVMGEYTAIINQPQYHAILLRNRSMMLRDYLGCSGTVMWVLNTSLFAGSMRYTDAPK